MRPLLALAGLLACLAQSVNAKDLTWSFSSDVQTFDPHISRISFTNAFLANIYETLVRMDDKLVIEPALAVAWERPSPTVWRFHLRPGVHFHNGDPFTADDVLFTWARLNTPGANRGPLSALTTMLAPDPMTIEIETAKPFPVMLNALMGMPIMDRKWSEANAAAAASDLTAKTENYATRHENGTGPFRLVSHEADGPTVLEAFDGWWDQRRHDLDRVTFIPIRNPATRTAALISGTTDATVDLPLQDVDHIRQNPSAPGDPGPRVANHLYRAGHVSRRVAVQQCERPQPAEGPPGAGGALPGDRYCRHPPCHHARRSLAGWFSWRRRGWSGAPQDLNERLPYDRPPPSACLTEAGYPDGFDLSLSCPNDRYVNDERVCQAIAAMWTRAGVRTDVQSETTAVLVAPDGLVQRQRVHARPCRAAAS